MPMDVLRCRIDAGDQGVEYVEDGYMKSAPEPFIMQHQFGCGRERGGCVVTTTALVYAVVASSRFQWAKRANCDHKPFNRSDLQNSPDDPVSCWHTAS